jgi:hypothetical protein
MNRFQILNGENPDDIIFEEGKKGIKNIVEAYEALKKSPAYMYIPQVDLDVLDMEPGTIIKNEALFRARGLAK